MAARLHLLLVPHRMQDMSMYREPTTCALVTPGKPNVPGKWQVQYQGNGFIIGGYDQETRDTCYKRKRH